MGTEDGHLVGIWLLNFRCIWRDVLGCHFLGFGKNASDLQTLFYIVVLVGINKLDIFTMVEDDGMVLVVRPAITKNWIARKLNSELGVVAYRSRASQSDRRSMPSKVLAPHPHSALSTSASHRILHLGRR